MNPATAETLEDYESAALATLALVRRSQQTDIEQIESTHPGVSLAATSP
jgi:hypothetical protein